MIHTEVETRLTTIFNNEIDRFTRFMLKHISSQKSRGVLNVHSDVRILQESIGIVDPSQIAEPSHGSIHAGKSCQFVEWGKGGIEQLVGSIWSDEYGCKAS